MYDCLSVSKIPSFYRVNLFNELAKNIKLYVVFISDHSIERDRDFTETSAHFDHCFLTHDALESRNVFKTCKILFEILSSIKANNYLISGWDLSEFWLTAFKSPIEKNSLVLESTVLESSLSFFHKTAKRIFLSQVSYAFVCGELHRRLLHEITPNMCYVKTLGVGLINYKKIISLEGIKYERKFLYTGRLIEIKNLNWLIEIFNELPNFSLTIVGDGPQMPLLKKIAKNNIHFAGYVPNNKISSFMTDSNFLILPSLQETWGLVAEEALHNNMPVLISSHCGVKELIIDNHNGYIFSPIMKNELVLILKSIDQEVYHRLRKNIGKDFILNKDRNQINTYLNHFRASTNENTNNS